MCLTRPLVLILRENRVCSMDLQFIMLFSGLGMPLVCSALFSEGFGTIDGEVVHKYTYTLCIGCATSNDRHMRKTAGVSHVIIPYVCSVRLEQLSL